MGIYAHPTLLPADTLQPAFDELECTIPLSFTKICAASAEGNMKPLDQDKINQHLYGMAMEGGFLSGHGVWHSDVISYAAVTGFEEHDGKKLAEIGGVVTLPGERGLGYSTATVSKVLELASSDGAVAEHGHKGFLAKCNSNSIGLFVAKFGFEITGAQDQQQIAIKYL